MNVAPYPTAAPTYISLFAGAGGLDLAVELALPGARCVCFVEHEISAAEILGARFADGSLSEAPIWSDVRTFDGRAWRGLVDWVIGGTPCQDLSVAGKREGISGRRSGLFFDFLRAIDEAQPSCVFWENVEGAKSSLTLHHRGEIIEHLDALQFAADSAETPRERWRIERHRERLHRRLLREHGIPALLYVACCLEQRGYEVEIGQLAASDVGAPHRRERVFILAYHADFGCEWSADGGRQANNGTEHARGELAVSPIRGCGERGESSGRCGLTNGGGGAVGHAHKPGLEGWGRDGCGCADERAIGQAGDAMFPPGPGDRDKWERILRERPWLAPAVEPGFRVLVDELAVVVDASRAAQLRCIGNGVVALQGAAALRGLMRRMTRRSA